LPFRYLLGDIITEVYGYKIALVQVFNLVICCMLFSVFTITIIHLPSPPEWHYQSDFQIVLGASFKVTITALIGMFIGVNVNIWLLSRLKGIFKLNSFYIRAFISSSFGEIVQYAIVLSILYYHQLSIERLISLIFSDYAFQALFIFFLMPLA